MVISVFDLFSIGIGPSSSHTVGPMRAARTFAIGLADDGLLDRVTRVRVELFGSLGATGHGHGSDRAVILGLEGELPETVETASMIPRAAAVLRVRPGEPARQARRAASSTTTWFCTGATPCRSTPTACASSPTAADEASDELLRERTYYSVGGGFVVDEEAAGADRIKADDTPVRYPFTHRRRAAGAVRGVRPARSAA